MLESLLESPSRGGPPPQPRFLSEADCHDIAQRLTRAAQGGGETAVHIVSVWIGYVRWARNRIVASGEDRDDKLDVWRMMNGARGGVSCNATTDDALGAAVRQAERVAQLDRQRVESDLGMQPSSPFRPQEEPVAVPTLLYPATVNLDAERRAVAARQLMQSASAAGMLSAGYVEVSAVSLAYLTSWGEYARYYPYTWAQYSVTVRDPKGVGSGWAGVDWPDWTKIDGERLSAIALDKCLKSRNPVAVEPGRYTAILEPQAVCDFIGQMMFYDQISREGNEASPGMPFHKSGRYEPPDLGGLPLGLSRLGEKVIDERITISANPMDPELGFPVYDKLQEPGWPSWDVYHPATWIEQGVLKSLSYSRKYAVQLLGRNTGLPNSGAFRMSVHGSTTSIEEMISTTKRGLLVTRFDQVEGPAGAALLCRGYTRDGLWLIENGKISKPVKNMLFVESILFALNNVEQLGAPQRVFHPVPGGTVFALYANPKPVIAPPMKIKDFSFMALSDAI